MMRYTVRTLAVLAAALGLAGCAIYPAVPGYAYGGYPYYAGAPAPYVAPYVAAPEIVIGGGGYYGHGYGGGYGGGYRH